MNNLPHRHRVFRLEHRKQAPLPRHRFALRIMVYTCLAGLLVLVALGIGILGYHTLEQLSWLDSFLNASMILGGMGPVNEMKTEAGKIFAGLYALFSGLLFLVTAGVLFTPLIHRLLHRFHFEADSE